VLPFLLKAIALFQNNLYPSFFADTLLLFAQMMNQSLTSNMSVNESFLRSEFFKEKQFQGRGVLYVVDLRSLTVIESQ